MFQICPDESTELFFNSFSLINFYEVFVLSEIRKK